MHAKFERVHFKSRQTLAWAKAFVCGAAILGVPHSAAAGHAMKGLAAFYWESQTTASGERFNKGALTAAHRSLPFGTRVRVTRTDNGNSVVVRINDRGPYGGGRIIDVSQRAAQVLGMTGRGVAPVRLEVVGR
jgi:rare lipoprotein A